MPVPKDRLHEMGIAAYPDDAGGNAVNLNAATTGAAHTFAAAGFIQAVFIRAVSGTIADGTLTAKVGTKLLFDADGVPVTSAAWVNLTGILEGSALEVAAGDKLNLAIPNNAKVKLVIVC